MDLKLPTVRAAEGSLTGRLKRDTIRVITGDRKNEGLNNSNRVLGGMVYTRRILINKDKVL